MGLVTLTVMLDVVLVPVVMWIVVWILVQNDGQRADAACAIGIVVSDGPSPNGERRPIRRTVAAAES